MVVLTPEQKAAYDKANAAKDAWASIEDIATNKDTYFNEPTEPLASPETTNTLEQPEAPTGATNDGFTSIAGSDNFYNTTTGEGRLADGTIVPKPIETKQEEAPAVVEPKQEDTPVSWGQTIDTNPKTQTVADWKSATGGGMTNLETWVENKYGTVATQEGDKLVAEIGGKSYEWIIDSEGNPIKTLVWEEQAPDLTTEDYFASMLAWERIEDTSSEAYKTANELYQTYNSIDKSAEGINLAMKNGTLTPALIAELNKNPQYAEWVKVANKEWAEEQTKTYTMEEVLDWTAEDKINYVNYVAWELWYDVDYMAIMTEDEEIKKNNDLLTEASLKAIEIKAELDNTRIRIENKYPNASPAFIQAMINRESGALTQEYNEALAEAGLYKWIVDSRTALITSALTLEQNEAITKNTLYTDLLNKEYQEYSYEQTAERNTANTLAINEANKNITAGKWTTYNTSDWLVYVDEYGNGKKVIAWTLTWVKTSWDWEVATYTSNSWTYTVSKNIQTGEMITSGFTSSWQEVIGSWNGTYSDYTTSDNKYKYPWEAWTKTNNPAWLTYSDSALARLQSYWINVTNGSDRPEEEGGSYLSFPTMEDGIKAYMSLWNESWYQDKNLWDALDLWGTWKIELPEGYDYLYYKQVSDLTN